MTFARRSVASLDARATAAAAPAITICPPLKLAGETISPSAASRHTRSTSSGDRPITAAIAPAPGGTACCIARPRTRTSDTASPSESAPAATSAPYSPRLCPAAKDTSGARPSRSTSAASSAALVATSAGGVFSVSTSWSSGPSKHRRDRGSPSAASASSKAARAAAERSHTSRPMPTIWEPWPGKRSASDTRAP